MTRSLIEHIQYINFYGKHLNTKTMEQLKRKLDMYCHITCNCIEACFMEDSREQLQANDSVDDNDKHDQQHDVEQWNDGHQDGVQHNL